MKILRLLMLGGVLFFASAAFAQNAITLEIKHKINHEDLVFGQSGHTVDETVFNINRLEYYISQIAVTHDGGQLTEMDSLWVLVDAGSPTIIDLGSQAVTSVESIRFYIGVETPENHLDPTIWPSGHALSLKSPSMHWGWSSGYRFVAIEGKVNNDPFVSYEIHGLGDKNYFENTIDVTGTAQNGEIDLVIYGNYAAALKDIDITSGLAIHGDDGESVDLLVNFRDLVFSVDEPDSLIIEAPTGISELNLLQDVVVAPNPAQNGTTNIWFGNYQSTDFEASLFDVTGKRIDFQVNYFQDHMQLVGLKKGFYILNVQDLTNGAVVTRKISLL